MCAKLRTFRARKTERGQLVYGFRNKIQADYRAEELNQQHSENRYVVQPHSWTTRGPRSSSLQAESEPLTWGVARYVPYCAAMPERFDGFVWF